MLREPHGEAVGDVIDRWEASGTELHAPLLAQYEIASGITQRRAGPNFSREDAEAALGYVDELEVTFHIEPDLAQAIEIAVELERHSAYDAAYVALAERLGAQLWTLDIRLARNARGRFPITLIE